jgi:transposase
MDPQGYDAGKKVTGRKRHILVDTLGLLLSVAVHPADIQDRDGVAFVLNASTRALFPFIERIFADGGYQGPRAAEAAAATGKWIIEIVKRNELHKFVVLPKRWIVERTFAWISRNRRLARDFERYATTVAAFIRLAMIRLMLRRLTRSTLCPGIPTSWIGSKDVALLADRAGRRAKGGSGSRRQRYRARYRFRIRYRRPDRHSGERRRVESGSDRHRARAVCSARHSDR